MTTLLGAETQRCNLLALPPELCNLVLRFVLVDGNQRCIAFDSPRYAELGLVHVCRRIRKETLPTCYSYDLFQVTAQNYNLAPLLRALTLIDKYRCPDATFNLMFYERGRKNWANLLALVKIVHEGPDLCDSSWPDRAVSTVSRALDLVRSHRGKGWAFMEEIFGAFRDGMVAEGWEWAPG